jgi:hypothetical protein
MEVIMAKKRKRMAAKAAAKVIVPNFSPGIFLGNYGSTVVWTDSNGKMWHVEVNEGVVRPVKVMATADG